MNGYYFKMFIVVTVAVFFISMPVFAIEIMNVRNVSGEIAWIDNKLGKLKLESNASHNKDEVTEYRFTESETRVTEPADKNSLSVDDLSAGQHVTIEVIDGHEDKIVRNITIEPLFETDFKETDNQPISLRLEMRKLWEDHITYTRNYIISALGGLEDFDTVAKRLLRNQDDIGDKIKLYYGDEAGRKLAELLREHILIATLIVKAAQINNDEEMIKVQKKWSINADDIAVFLSSINPNWARNDMKMMLHKHLKYTTIEVVSRLKKEWAADIDVNDMSHQHMLMFADMLTKGIIKQFPEKFAH